MDIKVKNSKNKKKFSDVPAGSVIRFTEPLDLWIKGQYHSVASMNENQPSIICSLSDGELHWCSEDSIVEVVSGSFVEE